ncbi:MAG: shikimate kinase AroK [gamma proteobacterium symbiont of Bathyaustriella thionipta]|nr:shikimate kinase AroK [gamma proteobacterium symbiont of Bathyaustriella thionipta]
MNSIDKIFLVGPMGAGKTTIGKQLASALGLSFYDSDLKIQENTGVSISTIFDLEGEEGFRKRESHVLQALASTRNSVVSTGGGSVLKPENRRLMSSDGTVIYLYCDPQQQHERTRHDRNRPLLQGDDPLAKLTELFAQRDPLYRDVADMVIKTDRRPAHAVVQEILRMLSAREH